MRYGPDVPDIPQEILPPPPRIEGCIMTKDRLSDKKVKELKHQLEKFYNSSASSIILEPEHEFVAVKSAIDNIKEFANKGLTVNEMREGLGRLTINNDERLKETKKPKSSFKNMDDSYHLNKPEKKWYQFWR